MIHDGYTLFGGFDSFRFAYRPAKYWERRGVIQHLRDSQDPVHLQEFVKRKIVWCNWDWQRLLPESDWMALWLICLGLKAPETGGDWAEDWEIRDAQNLSDGVILEVLHPQFSKRDCSHCKAWWYDDETGKVVTRGNAPLRRPEGTVLLCQTPTGCPKGTPENPKSLSAKNRAAWNHFLECEATGSFPDDPIVKANAVIIRKARQVAEKRRGRR